MMIEEHDFLQEARDELKRAEHQKDVSLKYTRTVDVLKNINARLISTFDAALDYLLAKAKDTGRIIEVPEFPRARVDKVIELYTDPKMREFMELYLLFRKISACSFKRHREFRRHVTMECDLNGEMIEVTIDIISEYYERTAEFVEYIQKL